MFSIIDWIKNSFPQLVSSIKGHLPTTVVFHQRLSSLKGCLPPKVSSIIGFFHKRSNFLKGQNPKKMAHIFSENDSLLSFLENLLGYPLLTNQGPRKGDTRDKQIERNTS